MDKQWREGDIVLWRFTKDELERRNDRHNNGTTYWCCSRIAIFKKDRFWDTYWHDSGSNKNFHPDDIGKTHLVDFVANFDELDHIPNDNDYLIEKYNKMYLREDIVNLNHSNDSRGNFYIRKNAQKNIEKMREEYRYNIKRLKEKIESLQNKLRETEIEYQGLNQNNINEYKTYL